MSKIQSTQENYWKASAYACATTVTTSLSSYAILSMQVSLKKSELMMDKLVDCMGAREYLPKYSMNSVYLMKAWLANNFVDSANCQKQYDEFKNLSNTLIKNHLITAFLISSTVIFAFKTYQAYKHSNTPPPSLYRRIINKIKS
jgi:hypothetical protein